MAFYFYPKALNKRDNRFQYFYDADSFQGCRFRHSNRRNLSSGDERERRVAARSPCRRQNLFIKQKTQQDAASIAYGVVNQPIEKNFRIAINGLLSHSIDIRNLNENEVNRIIGESKEEYNKTDASV